jgi:hypothetical protein
MYGEDDGAGFPDIFDSREPCNLLLDSAWVLYLFFPTNCDTRSDIGMGNTGLDIPRSKTFPKTFIFHGVPSLGCLSGDYPEQVCSFGITKPSSFLPTKL